MPLSHLDLARNWVSALRADEDGWVTYSDLRVPTGQRSIDTASGELCIRPGILQWWLASPDDPLLKRLAARAVIGEEWRLAGARFRVAAVVPYSFPRNMIPATESPSVRFTCWTPIVAGAVSGVEPLTPAEREACETRVRRALLDTYVRVYRARPSDDRIAFRFDAPYLDRHPRGGAKRILWRGRSVAGVLAPFTLAASAEMLRLAWECGVGDRAEKGFGFAEILG